MIQIRQGPGTSQAQAVSFPPRQHPLPRVRNIGPDATSDFGLHYAREFPVARQIADAHLTHFSVVLSDASRGRYNREKAIEIRETARRSIGSAMPARSLALKHTIRLIRELDKDIYEIEAAIKTIVDEMAPPILTIPGIGYRMGAMIPAEIGDFSRFYSPDKLLAYAGLR